MFDIVDGPIDTLGLRKKLSDPEAGALVVFEGIVRDNNEGSSVDRLEYETFSSMARKEGVVIMEKAKKKFRLIDACCQHRVGTLEIGDVAVWIGVISGHRPEAFEACRYIIDEIKKSVPIWKKEHYSQGSSHWVSSE